MSISGKDSRPKIDSVMVAFCVRNMKAALEFYTIKLGFQVVFENGAVYAIVARDGIEIGLGLNRSGDRAGKGACYLKVRMVDAFHRELMGKGVIMTHDLKNESYGMREFMITDPDGNALNIGEPIAA